MPLAIVLTQALARLWGGHSRQAVLLLLLLWIPIADMIITRVTSLPSAGGGSRVQGCGV